VLTGTIGTPLSLRAQRSNPGLGRLEASGLPCRSAPRNDGCSPDLPLTLEELADALDRIGGFEARPVIAVAVSGGPDSMALVLLADRWARDRGGRIVGLTVDHGLRPESGEEARIVAGWLGARGIPHAILRWQGEKPTSGVQAAAREARYRLLAGWCRENGVLHLLTAHQREDQAETHLIRRRAKSGAFGLAAMSAARTLPGCRLVRPLLAVPRARLLALLAAERQPFLCDPSNLNPVFERGRLRQAATASIDDCIAETLKFARQRIARERLLDALIGRAVALHPAGLAAIGRSFLATAEADIAERLLGRVAACIGGAGYLPRRNRAARLRAGLLAIPERPRTLGGCRFVPWRGQVLVLRELAAASPPERLEAGGELLWDRRFLVQAAAGACGPFMVGYLGAQAAAVLRHAGSPHVGLPRFVYPVLPALWDETGLAAVPHVDYVRAGIAALPRLDFRPAEPLTRARFTVV